MTQTKKISLRSKLLIFTGVFAVTFGIFYANYINSKVQVLTSEDIASLNKDFKQIRLAREEEKLKTVEHIKTYNSKNKIDKDIMFNKLYKEYSVKYSPNAATEALLFFIVQEAKKDYLLNKIAYWQRNSYLGKYSNIQDRCKIESFCNEYILDYAFKFYGLEENYKKDTLDYVNFLNYSFKTTI